jgi:thioesterase domain-containing protein
VSVLEKVFPRATTRWSGLASEVAVHDVPGSHYTMFMEPHVEELARRLRECLGGAASPAPAPRAAV